MTYDRTGEPIEPDADEPPMPKPHDPRCRKGWINPDADHPQPCLVCKPHLDPEERRRRLGLGDRK